jgi:ATP-binding cassette subfamily C (CFTR/MRP) protein 1
MFIIELKFGMVGQIVSVERVQEYIDLKPEAPLEDERHRPPPTWPERGAIEFDHFSMRYRAGLDLVLRDLTFRVEPDEKLGICGRTGAGKSSVTMVGVISQSRLKFFLLKYGWWCLQALFRVVEGASGRILIDDIDIGTIGLRDLRSRCVCVPLRRLEQSF